MTRRTFACLPAIATVPALLASVPLRIRVQHRVQTMDLEQYTRGVLAGEGSVFRSSAALEAMAITARTYAVRFRGRHAAEHFDFCDTTHCQRFDANAEAARTAEAVRKTDGEILQYGGRPALAYYSLDCGGQAEAAETVWPDQNAPYLRAHADPHCRAQHLGWHWEVSTGKLRAALIQAGLRAPHNLDEIRILTRTASTRAATLGLIGGGETIRIAASSFRFAVGRNFGFNTIQSDLYRVGSAAGRLVFDGTGSGHGVGLCQRGADQMGLAGHGCRDILRFYFPGTALSGDSWQRINGENIMLITQQPTRDSVLLAVTRRLLKQAERRTGMRSPGPVTFRVYSYVADFIDATGEPGWVAARHEATEIHLQPIGALGAKGVLESTVYHELLHHILEGRAAGGLPVWFREGLVEHLATDGKGHRPFHGAADRDLRQTADEARARVAYEDARRRVAGLVERYGETAVLGWVSAGLPREIANAEARQPTTKSR